MTRLHLWILVSVLLGAAPSRAASPAGQVSGITEPVTELTLRVSGKRGSSWSGRIAKVLVKEGDVVKAGDLVVELDHSDEELEATLRKVVADSKAKVRAMGQKERTLRHLLGQARQLRAATQSVSQEEIERKELEVALVGAERQRLEVAEEKEKIELAMAMDQLAKRSVRTPIGGTVVKVHRREGDVCEPNEPLLHVVDTTRVHFVANIDETRSRALKIGQTAQLRIQAGAERLPVEGRVVFVSPVADSASGLVRVKVEFANPDGNFRPGVPGALLAPGSTP